MTSIADILFNETASFYRLIEGKELTSDVIKRILKSASKEGFGSDPYYDYSENIPIHGLEDVSYSYVAFRIKKRPYAIKPGIDIDNKWYEIKFAFFLLIRCGQYVAISRKYVSIPDELSEIIEAIDYQTFANFLVTENTSFQKFGMFNLDISPSALRYKHLEAYDLKDSFSSTGAGNYELSSCTLSNDNKTVSLSMNLSRLHQSGKRLEINQFCEWVSHIVEKITEYDNCGTYLSRFATSASYSCDMDLIPINILFITHRIEEFYLDFADEIVLVYSIGDKVVERPVDLATLFRYLSSSFWVENKEGDYVIRKNTEKKKNKVGCLALGDKSIRFEWTLTSKLFFKLKYGGRMLFSTVLNETQAFFVYFQDSKFRYADKKLFANSQLIQSIPSFLNIFEGKPELNDTTSEKGRPTETSTEFDEKTIFRFIIDNKEDDYLVLDDMGTELADFIGIKQISVNETRVTFYVAKSNHKRYFSASSFQESIAQGLKNIGSFYPSDSILDSKKKYWNEKYKNNTQISKLFCESSSEDVVDVWRQAILSPFYKKRLVIVTDCISKDVLEKKMMKLYRGEAFGEKKEAIPMLWLISSFISTCAENGIEPLIYCKE